MTDVEFKRLQAICEVANVDDIEDLSDGFHTFNDLYEQRMYLFAALVNAYKDKAWKSLRHEDGEHCFGGDWFIVGIDTPKGSYTYHYGIQYWDVFDCEVLPRAKHWDGHTDKDVTRLMSLESEPQWISWSSGKFPDDSGTYIVTAYDGVEERVTFAKYQKRLKRWELTGARAYWRVLAWMPLPEPYAERRTNEVD